MTYWLMKSEPASYSIDDLARDRETHWDGIRNYQARNMIRDEMRPGDHAFFYHSSCEEPAIVGIMKISGKAYPDPSQFDPDSKYYDAKSSDTEPRWFMIDVRYQRKLAHPITLAELKNRPGMTGLRLLKRGNRLSVFPVDKKHWDAILKLAK